jgi:hypothetical protein
MLRYLREKISRKQQISLPRQANSKIAFYLRFSLNYVPLVRKE